MARVTVEDCILRVPNRFDLVLVAAQRAREIGSGAPLTVDRDNDKNPVVSLREIADGTVSPEILRNSVIQGMQRHVEHDEPEEDELEALLPDVDLSAEAEEQDGGGESVGDEGTPDAVSGDEASLDEVSLDDVSLDEELVAEGLTVQDDPTVLEAEAEAMAAEEIGDLNGADEEI